MRGVTSSIDREVLLVYPPFEEPLRRGGRYYTSLPLGIAYIASVLERAGLRVTTVDCNIDCWSVDRLAQEIIRAKPAVLGISVTSPGIRYAKRLIEEVRAGGGTSDIMRIAVGGPHVGADPSSASVLQADAYFCGEAEFKFLEYCLGISGGKCIPTSITAVKPAHDLDSLPYPARHLFAEPKYRFTPLSASRGCPFSCIYCGMAGTKYRRRGIDGIRGEIESLRTKSVDFVDDVFTLDKDYASAISSIMKENGLKWACTTRVDLVDERLLGVMAESGCRHVSFGVESGSERLRRLAGKQVSNKEVATAFRACREAGIPTRAFVMVGLPTETSKELDETFDFVNSLGPDEVLYTPTIIYPGTMLMEYCLHHGLVSPSAWRDYAMGCGPMPVSLPEGMSIEEVNCRIFDESTRFYMTLPKILSRMGDAQCLEDVIDAIAALGALITEPLMGKGRIITP